MMFKYILATLLTTTVFVGCDQSQDLNESNLKMSDSSNSDELILENSQRLFEHIKTRSYASLELDGLDELLMQPHDINYQDEEGRTVLHYAVDLLLPNHFEQLVARSPDLNLKNAEGLTALTSFLKFRLYGGFGTPRFIAEAYNSLAGEFNKVLANCESNGLDLKVRDSNGTPFSSTLAQFGSVEQLTFVADCQPDFNLQDNAGNTAAMELVKSRLYQYKEKLRFLLQNGADFSLLNKSNESVLSLLPNNDSKEIFEMIEQEQGIEAANKARAATAIVYTKRYSENDISLVVHTDGQNRCDLLTGLAQDIASWKNRVSGFDQTQESQECVCNEDICEVSLVGAAPQIMLSQEGLKPPVSGPNCFNTALRGNGNETEQRYTTDKEMIHMVNSPLCKERRVNEKPQSGDIIVIYYEPVSFGDILPSAGPIHAFTYLNEDYSFSKDGFNKVVPFSLTYNFDVYSKYNVIDELKQVTRSMMENYSFKDNASLRRNNGYNYGIIYDCEPNQDIETLVASGVSNELLELQADLTILEKEMSSVIVENEPSTNLKANWKNQIDVLTNFAEDLDATTADEEFARSYLQDKIESFSDALVIFDQ